MEATSGGPADRFLRGEEARDNESLSNDELSMLLGIMNEDEESKTKEEGGPRSQKEKYTRRSRREVAEFFSKHAAKRKLTSQEMADFLESRKRKKRVSPTLFEDPTPGATTSNMLQHQKNVWARLCTLCNSYDLDGLQEWFSCMSATMAFRVLETDKLPDPMVGNVYFAFYMAVALGAFPACSLESDVSGDAPEIEETHARLLAWAQQSACPAFSFLSQEQTSCFRLQVKFDGLRICFHSLWDVMSSYMQRTSLLKSGPLSGNEMHEFLHGEKSIYSDFIRESDGSRSDGPTSCQVNVDILNDNESLLIIAFDMVTCEMLSCPPLDDLEDDSFR
jgi:hypothetical protein